MTTQQKQGNIVGIITMIFLFGMISFVTNLAAPIGVIWKNTPGFENLGTLGNFMNFFAYLVMGIPAGKLLSKIGYKKTALAAIAVGLIGIFVQFLSGKTGANGIYVYLTGAFIAGAGGAAHLPGMLASKTTVPVLGVPVQSKALSGLDSLLSIVQMPKGVPVATFAIGAAGAANAALFAVSLLALHDQKLATALADFRNKQTSDILNTQLPD